MYYLLNNGRRRYKVINGVCIGRVPSGYVCCFDMEAELFLADSAPISVSHGEESSKGVVLSCEDFQITVILESDLGEKLPVAYIHAEPWKLLEALNVRLALMSSRNEIVVTLMGYGSSLATNEPIPHGKGELLRFTSHATTGTRRGRTKSAGGGRLSKKNSPKRSILFGLAL